MMKEKPTAGTSTTPGHTTRAMSEAARWLSHLALPAEWAQVCRTLLAFSVALYSAYALELESPSSAGMTVLIVAGASRGAVLSKSFYRALGTAVGATVSVGLVAWFAQAPWLFLLCFAVWLGLCTFFASFLRYFRSYGAVLAGYTIVLVGLPALQDPGNVFHLATSRIAVIGLGVFVTAFVFLVTDPGPRATQVLAGMTRLFAAVGGLTHQAIAQEDVAALRTARSKVAGDLSALDQMVEFVSVEDTGFNRHADGIRLAVAELFAILTAGQRTGRLLADPALAHDPRVAATRKSLAELAGRMKNLAPGSPFEDLRRDAGAAQAEAARATAECRDLPVLAALERADAMLRQMVRVLDVLADLRDDQPRAPALRLRVYSNPVTAARNGLRAMLAVFLGGAFWVISGWSSGASVLALLGPMCALLATTESAAASSLAFFKGVALAVPAGLVVAYALLPLMNSFPLLLLSILPFLVFGIRLSQRPSTMGIGTSFQIFFVATIAPGNPMTYNLAGSLDGGFANIIGAVCGVLAFRVLLPPDPVAEARVLQRSLVRAVRDLADGPLMPWLSWEHLQHQKLVRLSRRLAAVAPARRGDAISDASAAVLIGRAVIRARLLATRPEMPPEGAAIVARRLRALRRLREAPEAVVAEARQGAAELASLENANATAFHAAAMLHELASILAERTSFFRHRHDWLTAAPAIAPSPAAAEAR